MRRNEFVAKVAMDIFARRVVQAGAVQTMREPSATEHLAKIAVIEAMMLVVELEAADTQPWPNVKHGNE
jgi:hypothetical protein